MQGLKCAILAIFQKGGIGGVENLSFFEMAILIFFVSNWSRFMGYQGPEIILMITLISSKKLEVYKIMRNTVLQIIFTSPIFFPQYISYMMVQVLQTEVLAS